MTTTLERRPRPASLRDPGNPATAAYDWLEANGIDEWLPSHPMIVVDYRARTLSYLAFVFDLDRRGWDPADMLTVVLPLTKRGVVCGHHPTVATHWRTVPLKAPPSVEVLDVLALGTASVIEFGKPNPNRPRIRAMHTAYRRRRRH